MMNRYMRFLIDSSYRFKVLECRNWFNGYSDIKYLKKKYKLLFKKKMDLDNPQTFNEKLQWLKLYNRKPIYTTMVDKYEVKKYVADIIGEEYIIPTLGVWEKFEDIDFGELPNEFVLKTTHDSGGLIICRDKTSLDIKKVQKRIERSLTRNYYWYGREWPYKDVKPRIIAEKFMKDENFDVLNVYKIFNFNGKPKLIQVIQGDKTKSETIDYFDTEWNLLKLRQNYPNSASPLPKPQNLSLMLSLAKRLTEKETPPFLRTDFYEINGEVYFSEFTFFSDSGFAKFNPPEWDDKLGKILVLPDND